MFILLKKVAVECFRRNRVLTVVGGVMLLSLAIMMVAAAFDSRTVLGINPWIKPSKFAASFGMYFLTLAWLLGRVPGASRAVRTISWGTAGAVVFELPVLVVQSARGVTSHFNHTTQLDWALFAMMGVAATTQMLLLTWALWLFCRRSVNLPRVYLYGIRAGMALVLVGILPATAMVINGQHAVGVADGGHGLALVNWSTEGGDLRIAHFLGLHAIQVLPLAGFVLSRFDKVFARRFASVLLAAITSAYFLIIVGTTVQALAGQPLLAWH